MNREKFIVIHMLHPPLVEWNDSLQDIFLRYLCQISSPSLLIPLEAVR